MNKDFDIERQCRIDGKQPTARERWTAFYRLWRLACRSDNIEASDCLRVLMSDWSLLWLVEASDRYESNWAMPLQVRWQMVRREREKRLEAERQRRDEKLLRMIFTEIYE